LGKNLREKDIKTAYTKEPGTQRRKFDFFYPDLESSNFSRSWRREVKQEDFKSEEE